MSLADQEAIFRVEQIANHLQHPSASRFVRNATYLYAPTRQVNHKEYVVPD